jgi:hypothetical protein
MTAPPPEKPESPLKAEDSSGVSTEQPESTKPAAALDAGVEYALPLPPGMLQTPQIQVWQGAFPPPEAYRLGAAVAAFAMACALLALRMGSQTVAVVFVSVPVMAVAKALIESIRPSRQEND